LLLLSHAWDSICTTATHSMTDHCRAAMWHSVYMNVSLILSPKTNPQSIIPMLQKRNLKFRKMIEFGESLTTGIQTRVLATKAGPRPQCFWLGNRHLLNALKMLCSCYLTLAAHWNHLESLPPPPNPIPRKFGLLLVVGVGGRGGR
jgi:hypothetical protein